MKSNKETSKLDIIKNPVKKSFGINNGKKIYEGFNAERKVKNRKEKVKKRLGYENFSYSFEKQNNEIPKNVTKPQIKPLAIEPATYPIVNSISLSGAIKTSTIFP